ncbi:MAG: DciA family protein [Elusimicrobiaceae bacterium]|nr:DciA family protein [Elusimicrobiaceae bacterium]
MQRKLYAKKRKNWSSAADIKTGFNGLSRSLDRLMILNTVWTREAGRMSGHWDIDGVQDGTIYVKARSAAAAQELSMRSALMVKNLNKYFDSPWIRAIKKV